jgi:predicted nuclease of restriction endonuclease-like (RecB) superfamily
MELSGLIQDIQRIIFQSRERAVRSVNTERVLMYWQIGKRIFEEEQNGKDRAEYGHYLIKNLSEKLREDFGNGFSQRNLELMRSFFRSFPIAQTLSTQLSWSHYSLLLSIDNQYKREFYIAEIKKNNWSVREFERQLNSQFYERLLLSTNKESLLAIARKERIPESPSEIIKDPMVLEFLGLKRESSYYEKDLESAIITHLQDFLLELGNGFAFVARQKRIHLEGDDFYIDLVFYNRLLSCFVLIEMPMKKILTNRQEYLGHSMWQMKKQIIYT